jgi:hypothetical protein
MTRQTIKKNFFSFTIKFMLYKSIARAKVILTAKIPPLVAQKNKKKDNGKSGEILCKPLV